MSWNATSFPIKPLSAGFVSPDEKNDLSIKFMSWLAFVCGKHTHNKLKHYSDQFIQHLQGLVLITKGKKSNEVVGYCFKAKYITTHSFYSNIIFYDIKQAQLKQQFLNFCQIIFNDEYNGNVQFFDHFPQPFNASSTSTSIGNSMCVPPLRTPRRQMLECMRQARNYNLVFKPFSHDKFHENFVSLCVNTPMQREIARVPYARDNQTFGDVQALEQEVSPRLLNCFLTNMMGKMYEGPMPQARSLPTLPPVQKYRLDMKFSFHYEPNLAGHNLEMPHSIHIYPTQGFFIGKNHIVLDISSLDPTSEAFSADIEHSFTVSKPFIPNNAALNIDVYATYINECEQTCINQAGFVSLPFQHILDRQIIKETLVVPASNKPSSKGMVSIIPIEFSMPLKALSHKHNIPDLSAKQSLIYSAIERNRAFYEHHPASIPSIRQVTVFGFQTRTLYIPGCLFDVFNLPPTKEEFFINTLLYAYHRRLLLDHPHSTPPFDPVALEASWMQISKKQKTCTIMDMLAFFSNYCTYQVDEVDHNTSDKPWRKDKLEKMDSFDDLVARMNGDCEDFSMEILREVMTLKYNNEAYHSEIIVGHVLPILNEFIFVSGLAGVSSKAISTKSASSSAGIGGHECVYAIPNYIFFKAFARGKENDSRISQLYTHDERMAGDEYAEQIYILEGTGNLFPEPRSKSHRWSKMETKIMNCDSDDLLSEILTDYFFYDPNTDDNFYKMIITLLTPEFYFRWGIPIFEFLVVQNGETRGVSFSELLHIDDHPNISILACPELPPEVLQHALAVHENDFPPSPLVKPSVSQDVLEIAKQIKYDAPLSTKEKQSFSFQIRFKDMSQKITERLLSIAQSTGYSLRCDPEFIHHSPLYSNLICGGYNISFF